MPKRKRLTLSELRSIARELRKADIDVIQAVVVKEVQKERHYLIGEHSPAFRELLKDGLNKFCSLYVGKCCKGAERHLRVLLAWNAVQHTLFPEVTRKEWSKLTCGYSCGISDECRTAVILSDFSALLTYIVRQRDMILDKFSR